MTVISISWMRKVGFRRHRQPAQVTQSEAVELGPTEVAPHQSHMCSLSGSLASCVNAPSAQLGVRPTLEQAEPCTSPRPGVQPLAPLPGSPPASDPRTAL